MRIVNRETFLSLPPYTVYAKWGQAGPINAEGDLTHEEVAVKGETIAGCDWVVVPLLPWPEGCTDSGEWADSMLAAIPGRPTENLEIGDFGGRDGLFEVGQLFAVFNRVEVERLAALFARCVEAAQP